MTNALRAAAERALAALEAWDARGRLRVMEQLRAALAAEQPQPEAQPVSIRETFPDALSHAVNRHSKENGSDTPDWIIGEMLEQMLYAFDTAVRARERWYGRDAGDARAIAAPPPSAPQPEAQPTVVRIVSYGPENRYGYRYDPDDPATLIAPGEALAIVKWPPSAPEPSEPTIPPEIEARITARLHEIWEGEPVPYEPSEAEVEAAITAMDDVYAHPAAQRPEINEQDREAMRAALRAAAAARGR